jgi:hypothetical protein
MVDKLVRNCTKIGADDLYIEIVIGMCPWISGYRRGACTGAERRVGVKHAPVHDIDARGRGVIDAHNTHGDKRVIVDTRVTSAWF